jgi:hypothetical protein
VADDPKPETPVEEPKAEETPKEEPKAETKPEQPKGADGKPFDPERAQRALEAAREAERKAKAEAKELREAKAELDKIKEKDLSEQEKLAKQAKEALEKAEAADAKLRRANLIAALTTPELGIVNARAAAKLIEGVEYDDEGEPTNLGKPDEEDSLLAKFLSENEFLRGKAAKPKAPTLDGGEGGSEKPPELTAEELEVARLSGMSPEEYAIYRKGGSLEDLKQAGLKVEN